MVETTYIIQIRYYADELLIELFIMLINFDSRPRPATIKTLF